MNPTPKQELVMHCMLRPLMLTGIPPKWNTDAQQKMMQLDKWTAAFGNYDEGVLKAAYVQYSINKKDDFFPDTNKLDPYVRAAHRKINEGKREDKTSHLNDDKSSFLKWWREYDKFYYSKETYYQRINRIHTFMTVMKMYEIDKKEKSIAFNFSFDEVGAHMWRENVIQVGLTQSLLRKQEELMSDLGEDVAQERFGKYDMSNLLQGFLNG